MSNEHNVLKDVVPLNLLLMLSIFHASNIPLFQKFEPAFEK